jgi:hypothetical protein
MKYSVKKSIAAAVLSLAAAAVILLGSCGAAAAFGGFTRSGETAKAAPMEPAVSEAAVDEMPLAASGAAPAPGEEGASAGTSVPAEQDRKRVYSGYAELLVDDTEEVKTRLTDIAESSGGYVEEILDNTVTLRVPAAEFSVLFAGIKKLGDLLDSYEETVDVTEFYADLQARLTIAEETRDRLYLLLRRTDDVEERIAILREIRRLSEEIERINLTFEVLKEHISFSRITVRLISRLEYEAASEDTIPFPWIDDLHPLYPAAGRFSGSLRGDLPDTFAVFKKDKYYHAETADGVRLRVSTIPNKPRGDGPFWQEALSFHLAPRFAEVMPREFGEIRGVLLTSKDPRPYYYVVGVKPDKRKLHVLEIFFPGEDVFEQHYPAAAEAVEELTIK